MAYDFFPKTEAEIKKKLVSYQKPVLNDILTVFAYFKKSFPKVETPINIDKANPKNINVNRTLKGVDLVKITKSLKLAQIKMKFGNGSAGNRGVNNRGAGFEKQFRADILNWWQGKTTGIDPRSLKAIEGLDTMYGISKAKKFDAIDEGAANTKRPLVFGDTGITLLNSKGKGLNVGKSISDITLKIDNKEVYLSLKSSSTVTFFNVGVRTILPPEDIKSGTLNNINGKKLLKLFGIDETRFCKVFNGKLARTDKLVEKNVSVNKMDIKNLLESGIGYGYHILHQFPKVVESKKMDQKTMQKAATPGQVDIYYGGQGGNAKRIDITFDSDEYSFKLNIRDTQGKDGYPTRLMCDFRHK